jgi:hypothetical protein
MGLIFQWLFLYEIKWAIFRNLTVKMTKERDAWTEEHMEYPHVHVGQIIKGYFLISQQGRWTKITENPTMILTVWMSEMFCDKIPDV